MVGTIRYRAGQFFRALVARVSPDEVERALAVLTPEARALFRRQAAQDQRHALDVYDTLRRAGHTNPHLLAAALLHDAGKAMARIPPYYRAAVVLLDRVAPRLLARLSRPGGREWRQPFMAHARHPEVGACWAEEAGCSALTVALIRRHQDRPADGQSEEDRWLAALQAADRIN